MADGEEAVMDTKSEMDLIRQKIMAGLGVSEAMMNGPKTYATSSISATMAERLNKCPKCGNYQYTDIIVKAHNPKTLDMNMNATLRCCNEDCKHEWEGKVTSPHYEKQRKRGFIL